MKKFLFSFIMLVCALSCAMFFACDEIESEKPYPQNYSITFRQENAEDVKFTIQRGELFDFSNLPEIVPKKGYDAEWEQFNVNNFGVENIINAIYTPKDYIVNLDVNGGTIEGQSIINITYDTELLLNTPVKGEALFLGWFDGEQQFELNSIYTNDKNTTLTAKWAYTITFKQEGKQDVFTVEEGKAFDLENAPSIVPKAGYVSEWESVDLSSVVNNLEINAAYSPIVYTVTLDVNGGALVDCADLVDVTFNDMFTLPIPVWEGYVFMGWYYNQSAIGTEGKWTIADNVTLVATWEEIPNNKYAISFADKGTVMHVFYVEEGEDFDTSLIPTFGEERGYDLSWEKVDYTNITKDIVVNLVYTPKTYTITLLTDGGVLDRTTVNVVYDGAYELGVPTRDYDIFLGWFDQEGTQYALTSIWNGISDITLEARWQEVNAYTITFAYNTGEVILMWVVIEGEDFPESMRPTISVANGYSAVWSAPIGTLINIRSDLLVTVQILPNEYIISFNTNSGNVIEDMTVTYGRSYTLPIPKREGFEFLGWHDGDGYVSLGGVEWKNCNDLELTAKWGCEITFDFGNDITQTYIVEEGVTFTESIPQIEEKVGYTAEWSEAIPAVITNSMVITIIYTPNQYVLTFNADGGVLESQSQTVYFDKEYTLPQPTKKGHNFLGWYNGESLVDQSGIWMKDYGLTLVARWDKMQVRQIAVSFVYLGKEVALFYVDEGDSFDTNDIPQMTEKKGYDFKWDIKEGELEVVTEEKYITGEYVAKVIKVNYLTNGGSVEKDSDLVVFDQPYALAVPTKQELTFIGWYDSENVLVDTSANAWQIDKDVALSAKWGVVVTFVQETGTTKVVVEENKDIDPLQIPYLTEKTGYTVSWQDIDLTDLISDVTVNAVYTPNSYKLTYLNGKTNEKIGEIDVFYGLPYNLPTPAYLGYVLRGWKTQEGESFPDTGTWDKLNGLTVYADWGFSLTFRLNNGEEEIIKIIDDGEIFDQSEWFTPTREGDITFLGWYDSNEKLIDTSVQRVFEENQIFTAKWGYKITFTQPDKTTEFFVEEGKDFDSALTPEVLEVYDSYGVKQQLMWEDVDLTNISEDKLVRMLIYNKNTGEWVVFMRDWSDFV